jgi:hypothetical protein
VSDAGVHGPGSDVIKGEKVSGHVKFTQTIARWENGECRHWAKSFYVESSVNTEVPASKHRFQQLVNGAGIHGPISSITNREEVPSHVAFPQTITIWRKTTNTDFGSHAPLKFDKSAVPECRLESITINM